MSDNKKATGEGTFLEKVGDFFKKAGAWCKETAIKVGAWCKKAALVTWDYMKKLGVIIADFAKKVWAKLKVVEWNKPVKPVVGWSVFGGTVALSVVLMLIFWL